MSAKRARTCEPDAQPTDHGIELTGAHDPPPLILALSKQRREDTLCDITIRVEGMQFRAHRCVLVASSDFMRGLICGDFAERASETVTIDEVASAIFERVLDFCYEGRCSVPEDGSMLEQLAEAAARFQLSELIEAVGLALRRRLSAANCMSVWSLAERLSLEPLKNAAMMTAAEEFMTIADDAAFESLPKLQLEFLLESEHLHAHEDDIYCAIVRWLRARPDDASRAPEKVASLMRHCRFLKMSEDFLERRVLDEELMQNMPAQKELSRQLIKELDTGPIRGNKFGWVKDMGRCRHINDELNVTGNTLTIRHVEFHGDVLSIVPLARTHIGTGRHEIRLKLVGDAEDQDDASTGFGFVTRHAMTHAISADESDDGLFWLRRFGFVCSGRESALVDDMDFPVGAEVRMVLDMKDGGAPGQATFVVNGKEISRRATGINQPVLPCVIGYGLRPSPLRFELLPWQTYRW